MAKKLTKAQEEARNVRRALSAKMRKCHCGNTAALDSMECGRCQTLSKQVMNSLTSEQADNLITYLEALESLSRHDMAMAIVYETGTSREQLDAACKRLGELAGRDYGIM